MRVAVRQLEAQEALRTSEERFRRAISVPKVGVLFFDLSGRMLESERGIPANVRLHRR